MAVPFKPKGYLTVTAYLSIRGAARAIDFYKKVFGATERLRMPGPSPDTVGHAELTIGDSVIMLADEFPAFGNKSPQTLNGTPVSFAVYVPDADATFNQAVAAGAQVLHPIQNKFYGDRAGTVIDPFGHIWTVMTHLEDVSPEEMNKRAAVEHAKMTAFKDQK
jgi:PhnB protein